jgi:DNA-binding MarR family transcriptional regulator
MDPAYILEIRAFNRWYTFLIGLLDRYYLNSGYSLTEVRVLYEIHHAEGGITAHALIALLGLDKGYLSRILRQFEKDKLLDKKRSGTDKRSFTLRLSKKGAEEFGKLNRASQEQLVRQFEPLPDEELRRLVGHMKEIRKICDRGWEKR